MSKHFLSSSPDNTLAFPHGVPDSPVVSHRRVHHRVRAAVRVAYWLSVIPAGAVITWTQIRGR